MMTIYTWGYRGRTVEDLRRVCREHNIRRVIDVRRNANFGRIPPQWKSDNLVEAVKGYSHYQGLGNWAKSRDEGWVSRSKAERDVELDETSTILFCYGSILLLCAEPDAKDCHRSEVAEAIAERQRADGVECEVVHL
jgi:uncharacterized protein (DUF488 family)